MDYFVCNPHVTVDTGITCLHGAHVLLARHGLLFCRIHGLEIMTVTALARVRCFHGVPDFTRHLQTPGIKFFRCINGTEQFMKQLIGGMYLTHHFMKPRSWHMTIGTGRTHPGAVIKMNGPGVIAIHVLFHLMAGDAKLLRAGGFHGSVKATPDYHPQENKKYCCPDCGPQQDLA